MRRLTTAAAVYEAVTAARSQDRRVALVPTMGALHTGHLELVRRAAATSRSPSGVRGLVVVSIFVNPLQFGPGEDYHTYPRDLQADETLLASLNDEAPDIVYAPLVEEMYPRPLVTTVTVAGLGERLEGRSRPGHFAGVCTVVCKLFHQVAPDVALFGRKDFQQLQVIRRMVADLDLPVKIVAVPTVRETDGLAMSSRNAYLSAEERAAARCLTRALVAAVHAARHARAGGQSPDPQMLRQTVLATINREPRARVDYVEAVEPDTLTPPDGHRGEETGVAGAGRGSAAQLLVAVAMRVGPARLIDNVVVGDHEDEERLLAAVQ